MSDDLEERIRKHSKAFEGLMSLIPADQYYAKDNSDQWQRKKQTSAEKRAAKKAKYDPASQKNARDVLHENERKRKRELGISEEDSESAEGTYGAEQPRRVLAAADKVNKKQKTEKKDNPNPVKSVNGDQTSKTKEQRAEKRREKQQRRREREAEAKAKAEAKKARQRERKRTAKLSKTEADFTGPEITFAETEKADDIADANELLGADFPGIGDAEQLSDSSGSTPSARDSPFSESSAKPSAASSISSIVPPAGPPKVKTGIDEDAGAHPSREDLRARLHARIDELRAARKADGPDGRPARNRAELLEARRKKEDQRKVHKKELRKQAKEDEIRQKAEAELALLRGSGSPLSTPDIFSPRSPPQNNFSFGRVAFSDGQQMDSQLSSLMPSKKRKGPQDTRGALQAMQKKEARLNGLDQDKKADIEEKDLWLNAKKRAHGERVSDNTSLLKKALKSKQKAKTKSEKEWNDRTKGVETGKEMRQKKREENLRKRREEKNVKGKKKGVKVRSRPGFEGSFKSRPKPKPKK